MRGKHNVRSHARHRIRITPAGAGKTPPTARHLRENKDHPRRCGENMQHNGMLCTVKGSPPQVRGKLLGGVLLGRFNRITPAGAGKTSLFFNFTVVQQDHPRRCGENILQREQPQQLLGSPPQVRGKLPQLECKSVCVGITPAGAGKTRKIYLVI